MSRKAQGVERTVAVVGGGVAGMSAACALAEAGLRVELVERRGFLGGRACSYAHPALGETIDNCQHALFGCCTNLLAFYERIGAAEKIHWTQQMVMIEPGGRRSELGPSRPELPAPLHAVVNLLRAPAFSWADKIALGRAFAALLRPIAADCDQTLGDWLKSQRQTQGALDRFWRLVIASALNADLDSIALPYAAKVIRELFMNSAAAGAMGVSTVPMSELYEGVAPLVEGTGGAVQLYSNIESATWKPKSSRWQFTMNQGALEADYLVLALPLDAVAKLLPRMPPAAGAANLAEQIGMHEHWPITSIHLWFDREITELDHAVLLDSELHWMYHKSRLHPQRKSAGSYVELVVSASRSFAALGRKEAIGLALRELGEFFPAVAEAKVLKAELVKDLRATFGVPPGIDAYRPAAESSWPNCFLAGDWTATGWPSTMESAARSGHLAAEAVCRAMGIKRSFLAPDLAPTGLMKRFGR